MPKITTDDGELSASGENRLKVLLHSRFLGDWVLRQTPGGDGVWGNCQFVVNGPEGAYDRVVVYDTMAAPLDVRCPPDGVFLLVGEPPEFKSYHPEYLAQFACLLTPDSNMPHPRIVDTVIGQPWYVGLAFEMNQAPRPTMRFEDLAEARPEKTDAVSVMASYKKSTQGHLARPRLVETLQKCLGDRVLPLGRDAGMVADKWDALAPYKYHIALENSRVNHYITEKLTDAYLADCFPFYWGAPNVGDYFNPETYRWINLYDPESAADTIEAALDEGLYDKTREARAHERKNVLERHNMFALLDHHVSQPTRAPPASVLVSPESRFADTPMVIVRRRLKKMKRIVPRRLRPRWWTT